MTTTHAHRTIKWVGTPHTDPEAKGFHGEFTVEGDAPRKTRFVFITHDGHMKPPFTVVVCVSGSNQDIARPIMKMKDFPTWDAAITAAEEAVKTVDIWY